MLLALGRTPSLFLARFSVVAQVGFYIVLYLLAEQLVAYFHLPLPASIVGMLLLLSLIVLRVIPLTWVKAGAGWLLAEMLLFFVPAVVAVVNYTELLLQQGWKIVLVIMVSTFLTLSVTARVVEWVYSFELRLQQRKNRHE